MNDYVVTLLNKASKKLMIEVSSHDEEEAVSEAIEWAFGPSNPVFKRFLELCVEKIEKVS
jgi:hypothetical protein